MRNLAIGIMLCGFVGLFLSAANDDVGILLMSMGMMTAGALLMWLIERGYGNDE